MSEPSPVPNYYDVSYTLRVRDALRKLVIQATKIGLGTQSVAALKVLDYRLRIYPQFGDPLRDMTVIGGHLQIARVPPWVVRYLLDEEKRTVAIGTPIKVFQGFGL